MPRPSHHRGKQDAGRVEGATVAAWAAILAGFAILSCTYDPRVPNAVVRCEREGDCPSGYSCVPLATPQGPLRVCCPDGKCELGPATLSEGMDAAVDRPRADVHVNANGDAGADLFGAGDDAATGIGPDLAGPPDGPGPGMDAAPVVDARVVDGPAQVVDAPRPVDAPPDAPTSTCPSTGKGPSMVQAAGFCIDSTEVTNRQYNVFWKEKGNNTGGQIARCKWNDNYAPDSYDLDWPYATGRDDYPVVNLDWCDAYAFCEWAGKRLCGKKGGGPLPRDQSEDWQISQWASACSAEGAHAFPYGDGYRKLCNTERERAGANIDKVKAHDGCVGGYSGLYDMSGNIEEWIDACEANPADATGETDDCATMGGKLSALPAATGCYDSRASDKRNDRYVVRGFRCCSK